MGRLIVELQIIRMVQLIDLARVISHSISLPREIRMVAPIYGVEIGILFKPQAGERSTHLFIRRIEKLPKGWTISNLVMRIGAI